MPNTRLVRAALATAMYFSGMTFAAGQSSSLTAQVAGPFSPSPWMSPLASFSLSTVKPATSSSLSRPTRAPVKDNGAHAVQAHDESEPFSDASISQGLRDTLIGLAMQLRHVRYVHGGRDPATGFDCSGFVRYVFERVIGLRLPSDSASQYQVGHNIRRNDMQPGDLVFFRTAGTRHGKGRVSHVAIYLGEGRFIHSPRRGESVRVDNLADSYWAKHFAGARRPDAMAQIDADTHSG